MREKLSPHFAEEETEALRHGVNHVTSINSRPCGSSEAADQLQPCPWAPHLPFLARAQLLFLELPAGWEDREAGRAEPREATQEGKRFPSLSEVWSHLCFATTCISPDLVLTFFVTYPFPNLPSQVSVALDNGQKWPCKSGSFGYIKSFLHKEDWGI